MYLTAQELPVRHPNLSWPRAKHLRRRPGWPILCQIPTRTKVLKH